MSSSTDSQCKNEYYLLFSTASNGKKTLGLLTNEEVAQHAMKRTCPAHISRLSNELHFQILLNFSAKTPIACVLTLETILNKYQKLRAGSWHFTKEVERGLHILAFNTITSRIRSIQNSLWYLLKVLWEAYAMQESGETPFISCIVIALSLTSYKTT